jgi:hypothetical protein
MPRAVFPAARRSATAVQGKSDIRNENIYSAVVVAHGGTGRAKLFTVPQGGTIPELFAGVTATANAHQTRYTDLTTNLEKAGELGSAIGDAALLAMGITIEQAAYTLATGVTRAFGATNFETADVCSKCVAEMKVGGKRQIIGPVWSFPNLGAISGSIGGGGAVGPLGVLAAVSIQNIGATNSGRKFTGAPVMVARDDVFLVEFSVAGSAALAFSTGAAADGQPCLVWVNFHAQIAGDVR